ncbi:hypothetical protein BDV38DRAFT_234126 [Aspergillus pseudotamarii]|uniref:Uncharacterized protein n=1 Tax=Aspergillus pseudotamarii TaxID=132259 RepID=A0A5N6T8Z9_ASPPS|nr:uncharacterized protein BDV38DRAFT_234126 [Aspergillus pseudotamarii]KAE8142848.1 hypothetical protein BDV38DRAFT_234126 [Aspergillus pseudotamarii]
MMGGLLHRSVFVCFTHYLVPLSRVYTDIEEISTLLEACPGCRLLSAWATGLASHHIRCVTKTTSLGDSSRLELFSYSRIALVSCMRFCIPCPFVRSLHRLIADFQEKC